MLRTMDSVSTYKIQKIIDMIRAIGTTATTDVRYGGERE
jgi:hypothetical protein